MMRGIDIANWQAGLTIPAYADFCVVKASEGTTFVDPYARGFIDQCKHKNILFGFYHFLTRANPEEQAAFFASVTSDWNLQGVPVLDIERENIECWGEWAQRFVDKYHAITTVYPVIYCQASRLNEFDGYPLVDTCGIWVAGYPSKRAYEWGETPEFPYEVAPWPFAAMWQFTENGWIDTFDSALDFDVAYMDEHAWALYANPLQGALDATISMPKPADVPSGSKRYHFSNNLMDIDVTLKRGK